MLHLPGMDKFGSPVVQSDQKVPLKIQVGWVVYS